MDDPNKTKISITNIFTTIKFGVIGLLSAETFYLSQVVATRLNNYLIHTGREILTQIACLIYIITIAVYLYFRNSHAELIKIIRSKRLDLAIIFYAGIIISIYFDGIGSFLYKDVIANLTINQLFILVTIPFILIISFLVRAIQIWLIKRNKKDYSFFISDTELNSEKDDVLDVSEIAARFAERVINLESSNSLVFGIDAPWGTGKSTFVNFCKTYWKKKYKDKVILYVFNPLRYENRENLLEKFIDSLIRIIQKNTFNPEIKPIISRYSQFLRSIKANFFGFLNFEVLGKNYSIDDAFQDLEMVLSTIDNKIIVVIDDLDRLPLSAVKDILFAVKKSFTLPNISYIFCYDVENISALEEKQPNTEKVTEFLEKFVDVKVSLYLNSDDLSNYISKGLKISLSGNSQTDPILVLQAISGLKEIFSFPDYYRYVPFIGDIRKLKKLINTVLLLDIEKTNFDNTDINNQDLIHLLLVYINYPNIFRKIYNTETAGRKGFFSAVSQLEDGYPKEQNSKTNFKDSKYKNSIQYSEYLKSLNDNQKFILNKIFDVTKRFDNRRVDSISPEMKYSLACFNGDMWSSGGRNLEAYLKLIAKSFQPQTTNQYKFYLNCKNKIAGGETFDNILADDLFSFSKGESNRKQLWKVVVNSSPEFTSEASSNVIIYLINHITDYSHITIEELGLGLRHDLSIYLVRLLDQAGWVDEEKKHRNNTDENVSEIYDWIFGEGKHKNHGIISILASKNRGILGLYDLLSFRLFCSADKGGEAYNLQRALSKHSNPDAPTAGLVMKITIEEMREISQKVFHIFKTKYIDKKRNIFELVNKLTIANLASKYKEFIDNEIESGDVKEIDNIVAKIKSRIIVFIIYQLGNISTEFGIAAGYYDISEKEDKHGIHKEINDYLFNICFNPGKKNSGKQKYEHFLDYLLMTFSSVFKGIQGHRFIPNIEEFAKVLDKERLKLYWKTNGKKIKKLNYSKKDKAIFTYNYTATYKTELPEIYSMLDEFVKKGN